MPTFSELLVAMTSLRVCLREAGEFWDGAHSEGTMTCAARVCVEILEPYVKTAERVDSKHAARILRELQNRGLSRKTVQNYFATFKRMLALNDVYPKHLARWPSAPSPPRKTREAITPDDFNRMVCWLVDNSYGETADLAILLSALGARVQREVLQSGNLRTRVRDGHLLVHVTGKGGHERWIPCVDRKAKAIMLDKQRLMAIRAIPYKTHLWRWNKGRGLLEIKGLATFHAIRHKYATEALERSGGNLRLVQELLGHSNPATTAIYTHVGLDAKVKALQE